MTGRGTGTVGAHGIAAVLMRGGTSKGLFFRREDLPAARRDRDALLLRLMGSPDPCGRQADGLGGATPGTSKVVILGRSAREDCDVDCLFGQVAIGEPVIDWSGHCDNLSAAVGPVALAEGLFDLEAVLAADSSARTSSGQTRVRIWQQNPGIRIDAWVPMRDGRVVEGGGWVEDGVAFPGAEIRLEYLDPADRPLPTGQVRDLLELPDGTRVDATLIDAGSPTVFIRAAAVGLTGREAPDRVDRKPALLERLEAIRGAAAVRMGLVAALDEATRRPATPNIVWVAPPQASTVAGGKHLPADAIDVLARTLLSRGRLDSGFTSTGSIALAVAAAIPGTVVSEVARTLPGVPTRIGHASGTLAVGAVLTTQGKRWRVEKCLLSRSARRLMRGVVYVPEP